MIKGSNSMDFNNLITAGVGSIIGGMMTLLGAKYTIGEEYHLKKEEVRREKADDRIKFLYGPLLKLMSPPPPYDDSYLEPNVCTEVINLIEKNELYASPDLLELFWEFRYVHYNGTEESNTTSKIDSDLYKKAFSDYEDLRDILGYGPIKEVPAYSSVLRKIRSCPRFILNKVKATRRRINRRRRRKLLKARSG
jgi:hypothetical protein